jgi:hypothetical protein
MRLFYDAFLHPAAGGLADAEWPGGKAGDGIADRNTPFPSRTFFGVVQIRVTRETWNPLVGAALATFGVTHKPLALNHADHGVTQFPA